MEPTLEKVYAVVSKINSEIQTDMLSGILFGGTSGAFWITLPNLPLPEILWHSASDPVEEMEEIVRKRIDDKNYFGNYKAVS